MRLNGLHLIQEIAEWLKEHASDIYGSLNPGTSEAPTIWPDVLRGYYRVYNGQIRHSDCLFQQYGNWLSVEDAVAARDSWLELSDICDHPWYKESYYPIVADLEQMDFAIVIDVETGQVGHVDYEVQEFDLLYEDVDQLFAELLHSLKTDGFPYPEAVEYVNYSDEDLDERQRQRALKVEEENCVSEPTPSSEQLFIWGITLFRNEGDPRFREPNVHFMRLARKYLEQIPLSDLSKKQRRDLAVFTQRYHQICGAPEK